MAGPVPQYQAIIHQWQEEMIVTEMTIDGLEGTLSRMVHRQPLQIFMSVPQKFWETVKQKQEDNTDSNVFIQLKIRCTQMRFDLNKQTDILITTE
jgi:hypothetical protein